MRSYLLVTLSAIVLGGLFIVVWTMQPASKSAMREESLGAPPALHREQGYGPIKSGDIVWIKQYDRAGQLSSRFSGDEYLPQPDGTVKVTHPRAEFFLANHQRLQIDGLDGNVVMKDVPRLTLGGPSTAAPPAPPSRGRLNDVTVRLMDDATHEELLTMTTNNVVFDNETFRVSTEGYTDAQHHLIQDDQVPVHVRGRLIMEGRGLIVRWDDKDGRLDLLQIAHGDWMEIADPSGLSLSGAKASSPAAPTARARGPLPEMLADASNDAEINILTHHPPVSRTDDASAHSSRAHTAPIYHATFFNDVMINQPDPECKLSLVCMPWYWADQVHISHADQMDVDFLMKQSSPAPATQPAPVVASATARSTQAAAPATQAATSSASPSPAAAPQKEPPIFIHWSGPLRITPAQSPPPVSLQQGESAVVLVGQPVRLHRIESKGQGAENVQSAKVTYATAGQKVWFDKSPVCPQIKIDKIPAPSAKEQNPTHLVSTGQVEYSRVDSKAVLTGPGKADVPLEPDPKTPHPVLNAAWQRQAEFDFTETAGKQSSVKFGHFEGNVDIIHPKLALQSQSLDLLFDPPSKSIEANPTTRPASSQPNLRQLIASTGVHCRVEGNDGKKQNIDGDRLVLDTEKSSDGKLYARHINADGHVHTWGDDDLKAENLDVLLNPAKKKETVASMTKTNDNDAAQVELDKMVARGDVIATSKDGSIATGDKLVVTNVNGQQQTVLTGGIDSSVWPLTSGPYATITDVKGNIVHGHEIQYNSVDGKAHIVGPGTLHAIQQASTTQPAQPMDVAWANEAIFNGEANKIDVDGAVVSHSMDKNGFVSVATGQHMHIDLRAKPATQPAAEAVALQDDVPGPTTAPVVAGGNVKMDPFKGKEVSAVTITTAAKLTRTLYDSSNSIVQQFELEGPTIIMNEFGPDGTPGRTITVPAAGKMLARDHRPRAAQPQSSTANDDAGSARGATAFQWQNRLLYIEQAHRADITGRVVIIHQDDEPSSPPVRMDSEHVIAFFQDAPKRSGAEKKAGEDAPQMQLQYLRSMGNPVVVTRELTRVTGQEVDFDPKRRLLIATGTQQNPVTFTDGTASGGVAERVEWETDTWRIRAHNAIFDDRPTGSGVQSASAKKQQQQPQQLPLSPTSTLNGNKR